MTESCMDGYYGAKEAEKLAKIEYDRKLKAILNKRKYSKACNIRRYMVICC